MMNLVLFSIVMYNVQGVHDVCLSCVSKITVSIEDYVCQSMDVGKINAFHS